jgi:hypothetical protein
LLLFASKRLVEGMTEARPKKRGVSLGLVGLLVFLLPPIGLAVAWWHPAFREGKKRDPLLVIVVWLYVVSVAYVELMLAFYEK